jgi:hypothetical protein
MKHLFRALGGTKNHASDARKLSNDSNRPRNCSLSTIFQQPASAVRWGMYRWAIYGIGLKPAAFLIDF